MLDWLLDSNSSQMFYSIHHLLVSSHQWVNVLKLPFPVLKALRFHNWNCAMLQKLCFPWELLSILNINIEGKCRCKIKTKSTIMVAVGDWTPIRCARSRKLLDQNKDFSLLVEWNVRNYSVFSFFLSFFFFFFFFRPPRSCLENKAWSMLLLAVKASATIVRLCGFKY